MIDTAIGNLPEAYEAIVRDSLAINYGMPSDKQTGALLRVLAASKTHGRFLELGTGTGLGAAWLLSGMDSESTLISVESNGEYQNIARKHLSKDARLTLLECDGLAYIENAKEEAFDFIYADTWPGKYIGFEHSLRILKRGGVIVLDDMLPQPNWPEDHPPKVANLLRTIDALPTDQFAVVRQCWYTGHILIAKK